MQHKRKINGERVNENVNKISHTKKNENDVNNLYIKLGKVAFSIIAFKYFLISNIKIFFKQQYRKLRFFAAGF